MKTQRSSDNRVDKQQAIVMCRPGEETFVWRMFSFHFRSLSQWSKGWMDKQNQQFFDEDKTIA